ncbi:MAG: hybrid sensor histidine kinase/response regulator [Anaerolineae bacterium]|nr:hybrid sensor histidine kinase/response regulator [Anaerolineae bacterium]
MTSKTLPSILVVDDEVSNRQLLERLLSKECQIYIADSAESALDGLVKMPFDLALIDIMMPGMSGLEVLKRIRHDPKTADLPVILISALVDTNDIARGLELGANDYLTKPLDLEVTVARVRTQLRLKRLEEERKNTIQQLEAARELQDRLLRIASHDLKGPIGNVSMIISLMKESVDTIPNGVELLDALTVSINTMQNIITNFLDTAAINPDTIRLNPVEIDLVACVRHLVKQFAVHATQKDITINIDGVSGTIYADRARFEQALANLISNAIKYSPRNTEVRVWAESVGLRTRVHVADQGPGIPPDEHDLLFTQFGKLSTRPTDGENSTGLGLWIVKHLVEMQDGSVGVEDGPNGGSIFWIELANARAAQPAYS